MLGFSRFGVCPVPGWHMLLGGGEKARLCLVEGGVPVPEAVVAVVPRPTAGAHSRVPPLPVKGFTTGGTVLLEVLAEGVRCVDVSPEPGA